MSKQDVSDEEDKEDERTTPIGLFNFAESYWQAAAELYKLGLKSTHPVSPVSFLYYHAIELYLKSFLRLMGHGAKELRSNKFGHDTAALTARAEALGLPFADEDKQVFALMSNTEVVIRSRYIQTGSFKWPTVEALERICVSLRKSIGNALRNHGIAMRV